MVLLYDKVLTSLAEIQENISSSYEENSFFSDEFYNCRNNCSGDCSGDCSGSCAGGCEEHCSAACQSSCSGSCEYLSDD